MGGVLNLQARARRNALRSLRAMQTRRAQLEEAERAVQAAGGRIPDALAEQLPPP
ncbi:MAG: hypothetical protein ACLGIG_08910 [Actinomycetes bacterium]